MDERDKDLTGLFVRDLDQIALPPRADWRRAPGRESATIRAARTLLAAGAFAAVVAAALVLGFQLNQRQQGAAAPSASPTPSSQASRGASGTPTGSVGPTASPSPPLNAAGGYNDDFGVVLTEPGAGRTTTIRRESGARLGSFDQEQFAVSPDGRRIAWFTPSSALPQQLRVASASDMTTSQLLRTLGPAELSGTIVWANDASGLLYQTHTVEPPTGTPGNASLYTIHTFDLHGAVTPDRAVLTSSIRGLVLLPIAWDRAAGVAAVVETGEGGFMGPYDVIRFNGTEANTTKTAVTGGQYLAFSVRASSDAKFVLGGTFANGGSLQWWPLADFAARQTIPGGVNGLWRPQTHEIATVGGCAGDPACGPNGGVRLLDVDSGASRIVYGTSTANTSLRAFRADGSAVIVYAPQAPGSDIAEYTLVPLSGSAPTTFKEVNGLIASVRLR